VEYGYEETGSRLVVKQPDDGIRRLHYRVFVEDTVRDLEVACHSGVLMYRDIDLAMQNPMPLNSAGLRTVCFLSWRMTSHMGSRGGRSLAAIAFRESRGLAMQRRCNFLEPVARGHASYTRQLRELEVLPLPRSAVPVTTPVLFQRTVVGAKLATMSSSWSMSGRSHASAFRVDERPGDGAGVGWRSRYD